MKKNEYQTLANPLNIYEEVVYEEIEKRQKKYIELKLRLEDKENCYVYLFVSGDDDKKGDNWDIEELRSSLVDLCNSHIMFLELTKSKIKKHISYYESLQKEIETL